MLTRDGCQCQVRFVAQANAIEGKNAIGGIVVHLWGLVLPKCDLNLEFAGMDFDFG